uniref:Uncharacterized protein n=1 Tax=Osmundaria fimbriata TaxID=228265 RepID=A0A1Z1M517_OSMFI|nr:hypothetical protein [Osmundaria fimbriata]ARW60943.1 hypothetical protein [Osmundaria fimbriata]
MNTFSIKILFKYKYGIFILIELYGLAALRSILLCFVNES